jgi:hypothetical protein
MDQYVVANARGGNPLDYLTPEAAMNLRVLTNAQRSVAIMVGVGYLWDAAHLGAQQNDAYRRWVRDQFAGDRLTTVPDELKLYLGGVRSRRYVEASGGLWTLCLQKVVSTTKISAGHEGVLEVLKDRSQLGAYMLKLRCAVEMADVMANVSNSRITGCLEPFLWSQAMDDRLARGRIDHMTVVDPASYLSLQALILASVFDHPDSVVARTFDVTACSTMRVREPQLGDAYQIQALKHMNWVAPQVLSLNSWTAYFGVMAPSFVPDRVGQSWLRDARFTTAWNDVSEHLEPGVYVERSDEIWSAVLGGLVSNGWYPATLMLSQYGSSFRIDTSNVRVRHYDRYAPIGARLALPYETRFGDLLVHSPDADEQMRPLLPCDGIGGFMDGDALPMPRVRYAANGRYSHVTIGNRACSVLNTISTSFCSEGLHFGRYQPSLVIGPYPDTNQAVGQFWVNTVSTKNSVAAGLCAGGQRLLAFLAPPDPINAVDDSGGDVVRAGSELKIDKPDVETQENPGAPDRNIGDVPIHEVGPKDAITVVSGLTGLSDEDRALLLSALAKRRVSYKRDEVGSGRSSATTAASTRSSNEPLPGEPDALNSKEQKGVAGDN